MWKRTSSTSNIGKHRMVKIKSALHYSGIAGFSVLSFSPIAGTHVVNWRLRQCILTSSIRKECRRCFRILQKREFLTSIGLIIFNFIITANSFHFVTNTNISFKLQSSLFKYCKVANRSINVTVFRWCCRRSKVNWKRLYSLIVLLYYLSFRLSCLLTKHLF